LVVVVVLLAALEELVDLVVVVTVLVVLEVQLHLDKVITVVQDSFLIQPLLEAVEVEHQQ
jgi:hypothetical protein